MRLLYVAGISNDQIAGRATSIDSCEPKSKEEFDRFGELLQEKITKFEVTIATDTIGSIQAILQEKLIGFIVITTNVCLLNTGAYCSVIEVNLLCGLLRSSLPESSRQSYV